MDGEFHPRRMEPELPHVMQEKKYTCEQLEQFTFGQAVERVPMLHATWSAMEMNRNTRARKQSNRR
jgi:hypothetical protein